MSFYYNEYEFVGQDSAGPRGGEVQIQVVKFFGVLGTSRREIPWADCDPRREVPKISISRYQTRCAQVGCSARGPARPRARTGYIQIHTENCIRNSESGCSLAAGIRRRYKQGSRARVHSYIPPIARASSGASAVTSVIPSFVKCIGYYR